MRVGWGSIFLCFKGCIFSLKHELGLENPWRDNKHDLVLICHVERKERAADAGNFGVMSACSVAHLIIHGVHPVGAQCIDGLVDQIRPPAVQHPEAQILLEFLSSSFSIQSPEGAEAALRSVKDKRTPGWCPYHKKRYGSLLFSGHKNIKVVKKYEIKIKFRQGNTLNAFPATQLKEAL